MPDEIWTCSHLGEYGRYYPEAVEAEGEHGGAAVKYLHTDHVAALLKAERHRIVTHLLTKVIEEQGAGRECVLVEEIHALISEDATDG